MPRKLSGSLRLTPRKVPRQSRSRVTVDAIVAAAAQVFASEGFDRGAVGQVAKVAGVSVGSLYQYFPTKDALIAAVRERASAQIVDELEPRMIALARAPLRDGAALLAALLIDTYQTHAQLLRALKDAPQAGEPASTRAFIARLLLGLRFYLEAHRKEIRPVDLELASTILVAAVDGAIRAAFAQPAAPAELAPELAALILGYLGV
jgi:AcrR family transcriptional regulator